MGGSGDVLAKVTDGNAVRVRRSKARALLFSPSLSLSLILSFDILFLLFLSFFLRRLHLHRRWRSSQRNVPNTLTTVYPSYLIHLFTSSREMQSLRPLLRSILLLLLSQPVLITRKSPSSESFFFFLSLFFLFFFLFHS